MSVPAKPAAGWYADPTTPGMKRYWDGRAWTAKTVPPSAALAVPAAPPPGTPNPALGTGAIVAITVVGELGAL